MNRGPQGLETDVWSLGCMLYTLVVGRPPFDTHEVRSTLNRVISGTYDALPHHLSAECSDLIGRLLRKLPHERIKLSAVLRHPFMTQTSLTRREMVVRHVQSLLLLLLLLNPFHQFTMELYFWECRSKAITAFHPNYRNLATGSPLLSHYSFFK